MADKKWDLAVQLRGSSFNHNLSSYYKLLTLKKERGGGEEGHTLAVMHVGPPACGMNAAVRSFVHSTIHKGAKAYAIHESIEGLIAGKFKAMDWSDVTGWVAEGGTFLGSRRALPCGNLPEIATRLKEYKIQGLLLIGGFEAYETAMMFEEARNEHEEFRIPIVVIPSTISNNVPGTDITLGCDTALNEITRICDKIRLSAQGTKRRVFVVETMGGYCGYLATAASISGGADASYIREEEFFIKDLEEDLKDVALKFSEGVQRGLIIRNENACENYNTDFINRLYAKEGQDNFTSRMNVIGYMQQGASPSPYDRTLGTKLGLKAVDWLMETLHKYRSSDGKVEANGPDSVVILGVLSQDRKFTPVSELVSQTDFKHHIPKVQWWLKYRPLLRILAKHDSAYDQESMQRIELKA